MNNIETLRNKLFGTIDLLNKGKISVDQAKQVAAIGAVIVDSAKVEVDFLRVVTNPEHRNALGTGFIPGNVGRLALRTGNEEGQ